MQSQARRVSLRKRIPDNSIKQKLRFKLRAGQSEVNLVNTIAQVQPLAVLDRRPKQAVQPSAQVGRLADIGFASSTQQENCRCRREFLKKGGVVVRGEREFAREHRDIVVGRAWRHVCLTPAYRFALDTEKGCLEKETASFDRGPKHPPK